jgi:hypothetical protein
MSKTTKQWSKTKRSKIPKRKENDQIRPIKYTFLYPGGHVQSLYTCDHYLWHTRNNYISSKFMARWQIFWLKNNIRKKYTKIIASCEKQVKSTSNCNLRIRLVWRYIYKSCMEYLCLEGFLCALWFPNNKVPESRLGSRSDVTSYAFPTMQFPLKVKYGSTLSDLT